jgi:DNA transposition AAA+ family ATPase
MNLSLAALFRHRSHVAGTIAKAQERREEKLGDTIFDEIRRLQGKALELLSKMESEGGYRGAIVAAREV